MSSAQEFRAACADVRKAWIRCGLGSMAQASQKKRVADALESSAASEIADLFMEMAHTALLGAALKTGMNAPRTSQLVRLVAQALMERHVAWRDAGRGGIDLARVRDDLARWIDGDWSDMQPDDSFRKIGELVQDHRARAALAAALGAPIELSLLAVSDVQH